MSDSKLKPYATIKAKVREYTDKETGKTKGDYVGKYKLDYETQRGVLYAEKLDEFGGNNSKAENLTRAELAELRGNIARLEIMHKDAERLVSIIQTKLRNLETQAKNQY